ncbi:PucR family transcriptional regulator [Mesobacillus subterraneus]|uniref:PucR C-terminal helix-turn-helix domain-containing protein n=1 Tax=Mesobacillus subterraneus TaxID=285983 RepID=A0A3R9FJ60_9BACI|nr:helix-turn-helix domain-containing protein [Mesobacillus subterraneus]RSD29255.1 hypothetical protein EJA10_00970 [Mesobacillus subterraneus]
MINKILAYFPDSVTHEIFPDKPSADYLWFKEEDEGGLWIGIPKEHVSESQLDLLKSLFHHLNENDSRELSGPAHIWKQFLFHEGSSPYATNKEVRFIQFQLNAKENVSDEMDEAFQGFFPDHTILWVTNSYGIIVEEKKEVSEDEEELEAISATFESDFFIKINFYIGKFQEVTPQIRAFFHKEKQLFEQSLKLSTREKILTFEKAFPTILASSLPEHLKVIMKSTILKAFEEDNELMATIKVFLESNSNASLAAKKLYVHRNTLQYRMDKFMEKSGVNLKDFDTAVMVYLACLFAEFP